SSTQFPSFMAFSHRLVRALGSPFRNPVASHTRKPCRPSAAPAPPAGLAWSGTCVPPLQPAATGAPPLRVFVPVMFLSAVLLCASLATSRAISGRAGGRMLARVTTIAFEGVEAIAVDVQVMVAPGKVGMQIVGLADKAVAESRERVQA